MGQIFCQYCTEKNEDKCTHTYFSEMTINEYIEYDKLSYDPTCQTEAIIEPIDETGTCRIENKQLENCMRKNEKLTMHAMAKGSYGFAKSFLCLTEGEKMSEKSNTPQSISISSTNQLVNQRLKDENGGNLSMFSSYPMKLDSSTSKNTVLTKNVIGVIEEHPNDLKSIAVNDSSKSDNPINAPCKERNTKEEPTQKSLDDKIFIRNALKDRENLLFETMEDDKIDEVIFAFEMFEFKKGDIICTEGEPGDFFYLIKEGYVSISFSEKEMIEQLGPLSSTRSSDKIIVNHRQSFISPVMNIDGVSSQLKDESFTRKKSMFSGNITASSSIVPEDGGLLHNIGPGCTFGEIALLYNCNRSATCVSVSHVVKVWRIDKERFRIIVSGTLHGLNESKRKETVRILRKVDILKGLDDDLLLQLYECMTYASFRKGEKIINKGDIGKLFYLIQKGKVKVKNIGLGDVTFSDNLLGEGQWFGESALLSESVRAADVIAESEIVETLVLTSNVCLRHLGQLQTLMDKTKWERTVASMPIFAKSRLSSDEIETLSRLRKSKVLCSGEIVASCGKETDSALYFVRSGKIRVFDESTNSVHDLKAGDYFGGNTLQKEGTRCVSNLTIKVLEDALCDIWSKDMIESVAGSVSCLGEHTPYLSRRLELGLGVNDFKKEQILGIGSFGTVWLVTQKESCRVYALKIMAKSKLLSPVASRCVIREKNIMASIKHDFILHLVTTFQDDKYLFLLTSFVQGGELLNLIYNKNGHGLSNNNTRFYGACILEALAYLHQRNICHRDLKPENLLVDTKGYITLIDFGFARVVLDKTFTVCGTVAYFAPEVILGKGHDKGVDNWAYGVILFEMLVGQNPFVHPFQTQKSLMKRIIHRQFSYPDKLALDSSAKHLISCLLHLDPKARLGALSECENSKKHPWFEDIFNGDDLKNKNIIAPWIPPTKDKMDTSHFNSYNESHVFEENNSQNALTKEDQELFKYF